MTGDLQFWDRQGRPITLLRYGELMQDTPYRIVAQEQISVEVRVSTVWLGFDHGGGRGGAPVIFETMIFGGRRDQEQWRYPTEAAAIAGHDQVVALVRDVVQQRPPHR